MIRKVKQFTDLPVAVITNGSLLYLPEIRQELAAADAVLPSLDAGTSYLYRKINRPHPEVSFERVLEGLHLFSQEYHGHLWPEVMLIRGLNDSEIALQKLADAFKTIRFEKIHLNTPTRPPVEAWVQATDDEGWMRAKAILGDIVEAVHPVGGVFDLGEEQNLVEAVLGIITRHPMREEELRSTLKQKAPDEMDRVFQELADGDRAQQVERYGIRFWSAAGAFYPQQKEGESQ
jgi:wyosine [tRNA(Phe)-imidazoG37] synthetase (radical SAM superfamily)